jgi:hypothetical protein
MLLPNTNYYPATTDYLEDEGSAVVGLRERPPLWLMAIVRTPRDKWYRFADDEESTVNVMSDETHSATMPGGFERCDLALPRDVQFHYDDLTEFSTLTIMGVGDMVAWEGRLETAPRTSGESSQITPGAVGWQAHLEDNQSARMIYMDSDLTKWQQSSAPLKYNDVQANVDAQDFVQVTDESGYPAVSTQLTWPTSRSSTCKAWFDSKGIPIYGIHFAWKLGSSPPAPGDVNWAWQVGLSNDDVQTGLTLSANLRAAGPGMGEVGVTSGDHTKTWVLAYLGYGVGVGAFDGVTSAVLWTALSVWGYHDLPIVGAWDYRPGAYGLHASDIVKHAIQTWCPKLSITDSGGASTITPTTFVIPHCSYMDPTTPAQIIKDVSAYDLPDWAVWENKRFWYNPQGTRGKKWHARVGQAQLSSTGPQVDKMWNSVVVSFTDVSGVTATAGPAGIGCTVEDASLTDSDPLNPVNIANLARRVVISIGTATASQAIRIGATFLQVQKLLSQAGSARLTGYVEDDHGTIWPAWRVRPGDQIAFVDAFDTSYRRIVQTSWSNSDVSQQITLDSPPDAMAALLERLGAEMKVMT